MSTAVISDLHLGSGLGADLLGRPAIRERFFEAIAGCDRLVLLGDVIELRDGPVEAAMQRAQPFFEAIAAELKGIEVVLVPGNHDHRLLGHWLEGARDGAEPLQLEEEVHSPHPHAERVAEWLSPAALSVRYPGIWIRDDVYATHGHYADSHITLPTVERLSIAAVDRMGGRPTGVRSRPEDYEKVHAPVYDLLFDLAQGGRNPHSQAEDDVAPTIRVWEMLGGASGRARSWRGKLLRSAVIPAALRVAERTGLGSFGGDFSLAEIGRSGVEAMHVVIDRLGIEAEHVIFGHIHRRGPLPGEDGRAATDPEWTRRGTTLHNTGCWIYVPAMLSRASVESPFWPGRVIIVGDEGPPRAVEVLAEVARRELYPQPVST